MYKDIVIKIVVAFLFMMLFSWCTMTIWNYYLVPAIMVLNKIDFLQAFGILVLSDLLFKSKITS